LAPKLGTQPPADLVAAGEIAGTGRVDPLDAAEADDLVAGEVLDDPESMTIIALEAGDPLIGRAPLLRRLNSAEMLHYLGPVHHRVEAGFVLRVPFAKAQALGLRDGLSHPAPPPRAEPRRTLRRRGASGCGSKELHNGDGSARRCGSRSASRGP